MKTRLIGLLLLLATAGALQSPVGQNPEVRRIPPPGVSIAPEDRLTLESGVAMLGREIEELRAILKDKPALLALLPDVQIYHNAVRYALAFDEFFDLKEVPLAGQMLVQGRERARLLREGKAPWTAATGLVVRGYLSRIDGSVQPYGLVVPASYQPHTPHQFRLDVWLHGRHEKLSELNFIHDRQQNPGQFTPRNTFVLHPYGRYCNAYKFAGEVDVFEALEHARRNYPIDEDRLVIRGFSMGGAGCWHLAAHHGGFWAAAAPGAGFAETPEYVNIFADAANIPESYEQQLWHLYNATDYALNFFNLPVVAYSGEKDRQIQAANVMARELKKEGIELTHIIGPGTEHRYHPESIAEIDRRIDSIVARGRARVPRQVKLTTWTLRYNRMHWVTAEALEKHWERARVEAEIADASTVKVTTQNIAALSLQMPAGHCPLSQIRPPQVVIDGQTLAAPAVQSDLSWTAHFRRTGDRWKVAVDEGELRKRHGLQGPIDDAFMNSFIFVRPTGRPLHAATGRWVEAEMTRAIEQWRRLFRGEARVKNDADITEDDIAQHNLILWGDRGSNSVLARIADRLPVHQDAQHLRTGAQSWPAAQHALLLIYPNPLNQKKYIVLNSGFTFREADHLTNARQVPRLPDYAVVDVSVPASPRAPGRIVTAGFFGERWELSDRGR